MKYAMIMHDWNQFLVPIESLSQRPKSEYGNGTTDEIAERSAKTSDAWFQATEHHYVSRELKDLLGYREGWGSNTRDLSSLEMGHDFDVETRKNVTQEAKIARGAKTVTHLKMSVAIPPHKLTNKLKT